MISADENGNYVTKQVADTFREYILNTYTTNIKSENIGTKEKPVWVTNTVSINFDLTSNIQSNYKPN